MHRFFQALGLAALCFGGFPACGGSGSDAPYEDPPPLVTQVVLDDPSPPQPGCELLVRHASSACRDGTWHVITTGTFLCGPAQVLKEIHVLRTNQPCEAGAAPPSPLPLFGVALERPLTCTSPVVLSRFHVLACPQGATWNWLAYDLLQCADGTRYIARVPSDDVVTSVLCSDPAPSSPAGV